MQHTELGLYDSGYFGLLIRLVVVGIAHGKRISKAGYSSLSEKKTLGLDGDYSVDFVLVFFHFIEKIEHALRIVFHSRQQKNAAFVSHLFEFGAKAEIVVRGYFLCDVFAQSV
ncbi:MAG: hypothetical protein L6V35_05895 [Alistipes putredinis]|nr:MAG: hypothetical protein L6V35_05895 [Alistipes putredinis]